MSATKEFIPADYFNRITRWWWLVFGLAVIGGATGLVAHRFKPPQYEAQAVFLASIDFNKIDFMHPPAPTPAPYQLTQYDEDVALAIVGASLQAVIPQVLTFVNEKGLALDRSSLMERAMIERHHAFWYLRFHENDPVLVQEVTNYWADAAYANLLERQKNGKVPVFVFFDLIEKADLPRTPTFFNTNSFVLAGSVIGLVVGLVLINLSFFKKDKGG